MSNTSQANRTVHQSELLFHVFNARNKVIALAPQHESAIMRMAFRVSTRMTSCAGSAKYSTNTISISVPYFASRENLEQSLFETVTHEIAHLLVGLEGREGQPHGAKWSAIHRELGGSAKRTHSMVLADGYTRRRATRVEAVCSCGCGQSMTLGPRQIKAVQRGASYVLKGHL